MFKNIELIKGDIISCNAEAIVNAANNSLLGGGGVDGAIHRAAGPELLAECKILNGCPTGEAKITAGYQLQAEYVIHTVGPVWNGGKNNEDSLLAACYRNSLLLAKKHEINSIAFPNISTGVYHFPKQRAAIIAVHEVKEFLSHENWSGSILFICFDDENFDLYRKLLH